MKAHCYFRILSLDPAGVWDHVSCSADQRLLQIHLTSYYYIQGRLEATPNFLSFFSQAINHWHLKFSVQLFVYPWRAFDTSLVMISCYGYWYDVDVAGGQAFERKCMYFQPFFTNKLFSMIKVNVGIKWSELLIYVLFYMSSTKDYQFSPLLPDF